MKKISPQRMGECIAIQLAEKILSGELEANFALIQEELASSLQLSRIPVREALQILVEQGLAYRLSSRHILVSEILDKHILEIFNTIAYISYQVLKDTAVLAWRKGENLLQFLLDTCENPLLLQSLQNANAYFFEYCLKIAAEQESYKLSIESIEDTLGNCFSSPGKAGLLDTLKAYFASHANIIIEKRRNRIVWN